ncbi:MAG: hypothetical protein ACE14V_16425, partial [bacterium]
GGGGGGGGSAMHVTVGHPPTVLYGGGGGGGGGGGRGGGAIQLYALHSFRFRNSAILRANGVYGENGFSTTDQNGAAGGNCSPVENGTGGLSEGNTIHGGNGGNGGGGAGGGILIYIYDQATTSFELGSVIQSLGAGSNSVNGGTLKIIYNHGDPTTSATISCGRKYLAADAIPITLIDFNAE